MTCTECTANRHEQMVKIRYEHSEELEKAYQKGLADALNPIKQIIEEFKNGTDYWQGQDEGYALHRIMEQIGEE